MSHLRGTSPLSEAMSDTLERNRGEKAHLTKAPSHSQVFLHKTNTNMKKSYADKNKKHATKSMQRKRKIHALLTLACLVFLLAIVILILNFIILVVVTLRDGSECMEFLTEQNAIKFFGDTNLGHVYKRDGLIISFQDTPMTITSENGSVLLHLISRYVFKS